MIKKSDFKKIKVLSDDEVNPNNLKENDIFLCGLNMSEQKNTKKVGDDISYFKVIKIKENGNMLYTLVFDKLEE